MTYDQLKHAIRAACNVAGDTDLWIFGSQAILGQHPTAPASLRGSIEVDVQPRNHPEAAVIIDGALGELSLFHQTHGFYVHGVSIESALIPSDWQDRTIAVSDEVGTSGYTGWCLESHDLAASKLAAFRDKDRDFVRSLLIENMIDSRTLLERINSLPVDEDQIQRLSEWVRITRDDLGDPL